ncbi:hypothetical protein NPIL_93441, partial [Nephila pilipes]
MEFIEEYVNEERYGRMKKLIIRCNNILFIRELYEEEYEKTVAYWKSRDDYYEFKRS